MMIKRMIGIGKGKGSGRKSSKLDATKDSSVRNFSRDSRQGFQSDDSECDFERDLERNCEQEFEMDDLGQDDSGRDSGRNSGSDSGRDDFDDRAGQGFDPELSALNAAAAAASEKRTRRRALWLTICLLVVLVVLLSLGIVNRLDYKGALLCRGVVVVVEDSVRLGFVNRDVVRQTLHSGGIDKLSGLKMEAIDLDAIESLISQNPWVENCQVYGSVDGIIRLTIKQREPMIRILTAQGENYYVDSLCRLMPSCSHFFASVPIVSGTLGFGTVDVKEFVWIEKKESKVTDYMKKLINFAKNVSQDDFLRNLIVQIHVDDLGFVELIPRISNHVIIFGDMDHDPQRRLAALKYFYMNAASIDGFESFSTVDVRYRNQVITK